MADHHALAGADLAAAEDALPREIADEIAYQRAPEACDLMASRDWDPTDVTDPVDVEGAVVIDAAAGTGIVAFAVAERARVVFAVEPIAGLRTFMRARAAHEGRLNSFVLDGRST